MSERRDRKDWSERRPAEGVRIIRAEEAQAALDAGEAAGRRPDDELRFGDVPPAPQGPRPPHRFPLPDSVDPASAVPMPPLAVPVYSEERNRGRRFSPAERDWSADPSADPNAEPTAEPSADPGAFDPAAAHRFVVPPAEADPVGTDKPDDLWEVGERTTEMDLPAHISTGIEPGEAPWAKESSAPAWAEDPPPPSANSFRASTPWDSAEGRTPPPAEPPVSYEPDPTDAGARGGTELPHWSDPPTGEVPKILIGDADEDNDDLSAWRALGTRGTQWRDSGDDWEQFDELGDLADLEPEGVLNQSRTEHSDLYSFDEDFERIEARRTGAVPVVGAEDEFDTVEASAASAPPAPSTRPRHSRGAPRRARTEPPVGTNGTGSRGEDLPSRVVIGLGLIVLLIICYAIGSKALVVLATVVITAAAAEAYGMLQRSGFRPATLLGLVGTVGVCLGAYWKGVEALPLVTVLVFGGAMMWYLLRIVDARPLANVAVTSMTFVWVAVLGSYAPLMLRAHHGKGLFLGAVVVAVASDIVAFLVGRWVGSRPMAPGVSPGKTVEGFIGGLVAAVIVGAIIGKELTPWGGMKHGLVLGVVVGLIAPAGDLFESMIKRDLGVKDSGVLLGGHGGLLDRFDSLLVVLPAAYYVATLFSIVR